MAATVSVPTLSKPTRHLVMDGNTLVNLEIKANNYDGGLRGSLLGALPRPSTPMGKRLLASWMTSPLFEVADINARLDAVAELMAMDNAPDSAASLLGKLPDLERLLSRAHTLGSAHRARDHPDARAVMYMNEEYSKRKVRDLIAVLKGFEVGGKVAQVLRKAGVSSPLLKGWVESPAFDAMREPLKFFSNGFDKNDALKTGVIKPRPVRHLAWP